MRVVLSTLVVLYALGSIARADNWPQWRGPNSNGVSTSASLPTTFSATDNIAWKASLAGLGVSSPIVWNDVVIATSQIGEGARQPGMHPTLVGAKDGERGLGRGINDVATTAREVTNVTFMVEAFSRSSGRKLWEHRTESAGALRGVHDKHNLASSTATTDGSLIYAWFGTGQLVALDFQGQVAWQRHLGEDVSPFDVLWGAASSPTLYKDVLLLLCDHEPKAYLVALDKKTGKERWRADRGQGRTSWSTPLVVPGPHGDEVVVNSSERVDGYDAATGKLLWWADEPNRYPCPTPIFEDGVLYLNRGSRSGPFMSIKVGGRGDVTKTHVSWRTGSGAPYVASLLQYQGLIYMANDGGIAAAVDASTGERVWQERTGGIFSASPVAGDGKVYFASETGEVLVLAAGRSYRLIARNDMGARIVASPAIADGQLFLRSDNQLFAVGKATAAKP